MSQPESPRGVIRLMVPRRCEASWRRIEATLAPQLIEVGIEASRANLLAAVIEIVDGQLHPGRAVPCMDPNVPFYEAPDITPSEPHPPEQREKFWRKLELNPPPPGRAPILPGLEYVEEAKSRFPHIYSDKAPDATEDS